jgi:predicted DNA-binding ribbon-helix-helix protein
MKGYPAKRTQKLKIIKGLINNIENSKPQKTNFKSMMRHGKKKYYNGGKKH